MGCEEHLDILAGCIENGREVRWSHLVLRKVTSRYVVEILPMVLNLCVCALEVLATEHRRRCSGRVSFREAESWEREVRSARSICLLEYLHPCACGHCEVSMNDVVSCEAIG